MNVKNIKKYIPNILTCFRIVMTPFIVYLGITNHYKILITLAIITALTDSLDGKLARKWGVVSKLGGDLDAIADKLLAIGLLSILIVKHHGFSYILILEIAIAGLNLYFVLHKGIGASLLVGKFKTWVIFITIISGFVGLIIPGLTHYVNVLVYFTVGLQIVTLFCYVRYWIQSYHEKKKVEDDYLEFYQIIEPIILNPEFQKRKDYPHHINESVYEHTLRVAYDCYKIGKKHHLDYKSLAVAGLLHDFYRKPWQYDTEKKPLLQKHGFTHAKDAVSNAKEVYGESVITPKVESIMITHMFPLNKRIPRNREAWLITLVDKADSMEFVLHPIALVKIFMQKDYDQQRTLTLKKIKALVRKKRKENIKAKKHD